MPVMLWTLRTQPRSEEQLLARRDPESIAEEVPVTSRVLSSWSRHEARIVLPGGRFSAYALSPLSASNPSWAVYHLQVLRSIAGYLSVNTRVLILEEDGVIVCIFRRNLGVLVSATAGIMNVNQFTSLTWSCSRIHEKYILQARD